MENASIGVLAGSLEVCLLQPMLFWKNASQQKLPFSLNPKFLYRGLGASVTNMAVLTGLQFPLTAVATSMFTGGEQRRLTNFEMIASSFVGGAISGLACGPMEVIMIQQQRFGGSLISTPIRLVSQFGVSSILRGISMACVREAIFTAGCLGLAPVFTRELVDAYGFKLTTAKLAGSVLAGITAGTLSHPVDTIKTCVQGDIERKTYGGVVATCKSLLQEGGLQRMFRGWGWRTGRMMGSFFVLSESKHLLSPILFSHHFVDEDEE